eukprot:6491793-Amphidinium_carterae.1
MKKPTAFFMPIAPKRGRASKAMRKPESRRSAALTSRDHVKARRDRLDPHAVGCGMTEQSARTVAAQMVRLGLLFAGKSCPRCSSALKKDSRKDPVHLTTCTAQIAVQGQAVSTLTHSSCGQRRSPLLWPSSGKSFKDICTGSPCTVERFSRRVRRFIQSKVLEKQATIMCGADADGVVPQVEVDEVTVARFPNTDDPFPVHPVTWVSYVGLVARGRPQSLPLSVARAPGPGPVRLDDWIPLTDCFAPGDPIIMHTDSAKAYKKELPDIAHTAVVHQLKKISKVWVKPIFSKPTREKLSNGRVMHVRTGTQTIDGFWPKFWAHLRTFISDNTKGDSETMDSMVRHAQFTDWSCGKDPMQRMADTLNE